jgi:hypothetical protein
VKDYCGKRDGRQIRRRWGIILYLTEIGRKGVERISLSPDMDGCRSVVNKVIKLGFL